MPADAELEAWQGGRVADENKEDLQSVSPENTPTIQPSPTPIVEATTTPVSQPSNTPTIQPPSPPTRQPEAEIITWGLNVRSGPGVNYPVVAHLAQGNVVPVIEADTETGWLEVQLLRGEETGWISNNPAYVVIK
jgi:hypothetical protein